MPGGDGTGPEGQGQRTGRGLGDCPPAGTTPAQTPSASARRPFFGRLFEFLFQLFWSEQAVSYPYAPESIQIQISQTFIHKNI